MSVRAGLDHPGTCELAGAGVAAPAEREAEPAPAMPEAAGAILVMPIARLLDRKAGRSLKIRAAVLLGRLHPSGLHPSAVARRPGVSRQVYAKWQRILDGDLPSLRRRTSRQGRDN